MQIPRVLNRCVYQRDKPKSIRKDMGGTFVSELSAQVRERQVSCHVDLAGRKWNSTRRRTFWLGSCSAHEQNAKLGFRTGFEQNELSAGAPEEIQTPDPDS